MRIFKTKHFARLARRSKVMDGILRDGVTRAEAGQIDAQLGKFLIKQRVERPGEGRSGGFRAVMVFKTGDMTVFLHLFPKSSQENLSLEELDVFRELAKYFAALSEIDISRLVAKKEWIEVDHGEIDEEIPQ